MKHHFAKVIKKVKVTCEQNTIKIYKASLGATIFLQCQIMQGKINY